MSGQIKFRVDGQITVSKVIKVEEGKKPDDLLHDILEKWGLKLPELVISVAGGTEYMDMSDECKDFFESRLMEAISKKNTWIITNGIHIGTTKFFGNAVRNHGGKDLVAMAITTRGTTDQGQTLTDHLRTSPSSDYEYVVKEYSKRSLDHNHTHFILVDEDKKWECEAEFRARFVDHVVNSSGENTHNGEMSDGPSVASSSATLLPANTGSLLATEQQDSESGQHISVQSDGTVDLDEICRKTDVRCFGVCLLLGGDLDSLKVVKNSAKSKIPVMVMSGTGYVVDILTDVIASSGELREPDWDEIRKKFKKKETEEAVKRREDKDRDKLPDKKKTEIDAKVEEYVELLQECLKYNRWITVAGQDDDLEGTILEALLSGKPEKNEMNIESRLEMAVLWNKPAVARNILSKATQGWKMKHLLKLFNKVVCDSLYEFVRLFMERGFVVRKKLTFQGLERDIYQKVDKNSMLYHLIGAQASGGEVDRDSKLYNLTADPESDKAPFLYLADKLIQKSSGIKRKVLPERETWKTFKYPFQELFFYAVLQNEMEMAVLFWELCSEPVVIALASTNLLKSISKHNVRDYPDQCASMEESANKLEEMAVAVLDECKKSNQRDTEKLLTSYRSNWSHTCLEIGFSKFQNLQFTSHTSVQKVLDGEWYGNISTTVPLWKVMIATLFPPAVFTVTPSDDGKLHDAYDRESDNDTRPNEDTSNGGRSGCCKKMKGFYTSPVVIFLLHLLSYLAFLVLFSVVMLFNFQRGISPQEVILIAWVVMLICEEIRQIISNDEKGCVDKLKAWLESYWNRLDLISQISFLLGVILRCIPETLDWARIVLCISLILFSVRILQGCLCIKSLGPKLLMIGNMFKDLTLFMVVLSVFLLAYGVTSYSILYPYNESGVEALKGILYRPFFQVFGEFFLETINGPDPGSQDCTDNSTLIAEGYEPCPKYSWVGLVLLAFHLLISNVLLLNLLIAMFGYTFDAVQGNTDDLWKYHRFDLIKEYKSKPFLPPPFNVLCFILWLVRRVRAKLSHRGYTEQDASAATHDTDGPGLDDVRRWEGVQRTKYLAKQRLKLRQDTGLQTMQTKSERQQKNLEANMEELKKQISELRTLLVR